MHVSSQYLGYEDDQNIGKNNLEIWFFLTNICQLYNRDSGGSLIYQYVIGWCNQSFLVCDLMHLYRRQ